MIHIHTADGKHEWLTQEELASKYPDMHARINRPRPFEEDGKRLKYKRMDADMSLRETAKQIGISATTLSEIELGFIEADPATAVFYGAL